MIKKIAIATALLVSEMASVNAYSGEVIDSVLASVGPEVILYSDIMIAIRPAIPSLQKSSNSAQEYSTKLEALLKDALEEAIRSKLLYRQAQLKGMMVSDERVEMAVENLRKKFPTNEEFLEELKASGESLSDFREQTRKNILAGYMGDERFRELEQDVVVTEAEVAEYYEENKPQFMRTERVRVRQIMFRANKDETARAKAVTRLQLLKEEIQDGADFGDLARLHSQGAAAEDGGIIGWIQKDDLIPALDAVAFATKENELSEVFTSPLGVHLLKVDEFQEAGLAALDEARTFIEPVLRSKAASKKFDTWYNDLRKRSQVRVFLEQL
jgi:parvulin-like peptidyl-prolyl isomerase